jgi:hypothetical protein
MQLLTKAFLLFILLLSFTSAISQVKNNRIENRIQLGLDAEAFTSSTTNSDVQWDCINRALTNTCLVYHNDQWFTITPPTIGPYFINIHNQSCKKLYGVQLVILEGDPCKTDSYQLKRCVPFSDQADFYVRLDSLKPNMEYLINVDGYLGDLCAFKIEFSTTLRGIPVSSTITKMITPTFNLQDSVAVLEWTVHDSLAFRFKDFYVYRKREKEPSQLIKIEPMIHNAYGAVQQHYRVYDTLRDKGQYAYSIYGTAANDRLLLSRHHVTYPQVSAHEIARRSRFTKREFIYYAKSAGLVTVHVFDDYNEKKLFTTNRRADKGKNTLLLDFAKMVDDGVYFYKIVISGKDFSEEHRVKIQPPLEKSRAD